MANEYLIPFGVDSTGFFEGLTKMDAGIDKLGTSTAEATKEMQTGFNDAAKAGDKLSETIVKNADQAISLREQARTMGKELRDALNTKGVGGDFEARVAKFGDLMAKFSTNASKPIKFNIDTAKLQEFENRLAAGANEIEVFTEVLAVAKQELASLKPDTEGFQQLSNQIEIAEGFMSGFGKTAELAAESQTSLRTQLKNMKADLAALELAGKGNTQEFKNLSIQAGALQDQIGDVSQRVRILASDTKYIDAGVQAVTGLAGAFTAAQGAVALFGDENESVQKIIQKVTGAMAVLQGIQAVANALNKDSALSVLFFSKAQQTAAVSTGELALAEGAEATAAVSATAATEGFTAALLANPVTAVLVGLAALITAIVAFSDSSKDAKDETKKFNDELERQSKILDLDEAGIKRRTDLLVAQAKQQGKAQSEIVAIEGAAVAEKINLLEKENSERAKLYNQQVTSGKLTAEAEKKFQEDQLKGESKLADLQTELSVKRIDRQTEQQKEAKDAAKKAEELSKKTLEQQKRDAEEQRKILEQQIKFTKDLEAVRIESIKNSYDKERATAKANTNAKIAELENEKILSAKAETERQELIAALRAGLTDQLKTIDKKQADDLSELQLKAQELIIQNREDGIVKEVETIRLGYEQKRREITQQFKDETDLRDQLIAQLNDAQIRETKAATDKFKLQSIQDETDRQVLIVETAKKYLPDLPGIEEQKQVAILQVKLKGAKLYLDALRSSGEAENSTATLQAKKDIIDLIKALGLATKDAANATPAIDVFKLFGVGGLDKDGRKAVTEALKQAGDAIKSITDSIVQDFQRQIDKKQETIDQETKEIDDLQGRLDKEKELRDQGFANNFDALQKDLDAKKAQREADLKSQEDIQNKLKAAQKVQLALDSASQASNLITASTSIYKSLSPLGPFGIGLAIATIGLMLGAFVAAKVQAIKAINDSGSKQSFGAGGWIDGPDHASGGKKYYAADGSGDVVELEGKEHVTNKKSAAKYSDLLDAINRDSLSGMSDTALAELLEGTGVRFNSDLPKEVLKKVRERDQYKSNILLLPSQDADISGDVKSINENVTFLAGQEKQKTERWEDESYFYEKKGQQTIKIKKK